MMLQRRRHLRKIPRVLVVLVHSQILELRKLDLERNGVPVDSQHLRLKSLLDLVCFLGSEELNERLWACVVVEDKDFHHLMNFVA